MAVKHPPILWAQRSSNLYLAVEVQDMKIEELKVHEDSFKIKGTKGDEQYEADLQLYGKLKGYERRQVATDRRIELVIPKETAEWWPHLLKGKTKISWIKVDFDKWKDEDEEKEEADKGFGGNLGSGGMNFTQFSSNVANEPISDNMQDSELKGDGDEDTDDSERTEESSEFPISASLREDAGLSENDKPLLKALLWSSPEDMVFACDTPLIDVSFFAVHNKQNAHVIFNDYLNELLKDSSITDDKIAKISILIQFCKDELVTLKYGGILNIDDRDKYLITMRDVYTPRQRFEEAARRLRSNWDEIYERGLVNKDRVHYHWKSCAALDLIFDCEEVLPVEAHLIRSLIKESLKKGGFDGGAMDFNSVDSAHCGGSLVINMDIVKDFEPENDENEDTDDAKDTEKPEQAKTDETRKKLTEDAEYSKATSENA
uniref:CS domain-containing protein n=1 Tax=Ditylenchus dipsaci TaxID=166011 RepID=A0A915E6B9_9BILA